MARRMQKQKKALKDHGAVLARRLEASADTRSAIAIAADARAADLAYRRADAWSRSEPGTPYGVIDINGFDDGFHSDAIARGTRR